MNPENVLLILVRNPELGKVKTRLAATIGDENALKIYQELLRHTLKVTKNLAVRKQLFYADYVPEQDIWPIGNYEKHLQENGDLGQRMQNAFAQAFAGGAKKVIVIGSDCYELTQTILEEAFNKLLRNDAVIGPATDGGYYLLGFSRLNPTVFEHKSWSTNSVYHETCADLKKAGMSFSVLPILSDVDEEADLGLLRNLL